MAAPPSCRRWSGRIRALRLGTTPRCQWRASRHVSDRPDPLATPRSELIAGAAILFDVNTEIGRPLGRRFPLTTESLIREMDRNGVDAALVRHRGAVTIHRSWGLERLYEEVAEAPHRLLPIATASVATLDSLPVELDAARRAGARGVWFEASGAWSAGGAATAEAVRISARMGRPIMVEAAQLGDATRIARLTVGLGVPVVLVGTTYGHLADVVATCQRFDHLYVETSGASAVGMIEHLVATIGHERILFGSGAPDRSIAAPANAVRMAAISLDAQTAILDRNARRLFDIVGQGEVGDGLKTPSRVIDVHAHTGPTPWEVPVQNGALWGHGHPMHPIMTIASSVAAIMGEYEVGNSEAVARAGRGDCHAYLVADPLDLAGTLAHASRWLDRPGIVGFKIHSSWSRIPTSSIPMLSLLDGLAAFGRPVLLHPDGEGWANAIERWALGHPRVPLIIAHGGPGAVDESVAQLAASTGNVWVELSSTSTNVARLRDVVAKVPSTRLLFGSDFPLLNPFYVLGLYSDAGVTHERSDVFHANAAAALSIKEDSG